MNYFKLLGWVMLIVGGCLLPDMPFWRFMAATFLLMYGMAFIINPDLKKSHTKESQN